MKDKKKTIGFRYAWEGLVYVIKSERNAQIHLCAFLLVLCLGFFLNITKLEWFFILFVSALVFITEIINSALEQITDVIFPHYDLRAKRIKDMGAASVLIAACLAVIVGLVIFIPKLF